MSPQEVDLEAAADRAFRMYETAGFRGLAADEQILVAIWGLEADVNNGGFEQFYFNSSGDLAAHAASALRTIGAVRMASIVEAASGRFGPAGPSGDRAVRQGQLRRLVGASDDLFEDLDRKFYEYPDDIAALLAAHLARKPPGDGPVP